MGKGRAGFWGFGLALPLPAAHHPVFLRPQVFPALGFTFPHSLPRRARLPPLLFDSWPKKENFPLSPPFAPLFVPPPFFALFPI